jgi:hypothetical protein
MHSNENFYDFIDIALKHKIYKFDSSLLNIGGCPFSGKDNKSNINTIKLLEYLEDKNYNTGINIHLLKYIENLIKKEMDQNDIIK